MRSNRFKYDAFVSHAVEDKIAVANDLCNRLEKAGLKLWYSGKELKLGDSLEKTIETGLAQSRYGIVILSQMYLQKNWPRKEYYMLKAKEAELGKVILPVLYDITVDELQKLDIHIADRWAISMDKGIDFVVQKLLEAIQGNTSKIRISNKKLAVTALGVAAFFGSYFTYSTYTGKSTPSIEVVNHCVEDRIRNIDLDAKQSHETLQEDLQAKPATINDIANVFSNFSRLKTNYRNEYTLNYNGKVIRSKKQVEAKLKLDLESLNPRSGYNFVSPNIFLMTKLNKSLLVEARYLFVNTQPITYRVFDEYDLENGDYVITVSYENYVRHITVNLLFPTAGSPLKRHQMSIMALVPAEKYIFSRQSDEWVLIGIE